MSTPVNHRTTNTIFTVSEDFGYAGVDIRPIPATRGEINKVPVIVTCFEFSDAEIEEIKRTGKVFLIVVGQKCIPHSLAAYDPFDK